MSETNGNGNGSVPDESPEERPPRDILTPRQKLYLAMAARGAQVPDIAAYYVIEKTSVKNALDEARRRMGCRTLAQAVARAIALEQLILDHNGTVWAPRHQKINA